MPFPTTSERVGLTERELGRKLPTELRDRLMRDNGGEVTATPIHEEAQSEFDPYWDLHPVWDDKDRRRAERTSSHIVRETEEARSWPRFPTGAVAIASNGTADRLVLLPESDDVFCWNHESGTTSPVRVWWD